MISLFWKNYIVSYFHSCSFLIHIVHLCEIQAPSSGQEQLKEERGFLKLVFKSQTNQVPKSLWLFYHLGESPSRRWSGKPCWTTPQRIQKRRISSTFLNMMISRYQAGPKRQKPILKWLPVQWKLVWILSVCCLDYLYNMQCLS